MTETQDDSRENISDQDLWNEILEGNIDSLGILYKRYYTPLFMFGKKLTGEPDLAEDAVQELFFKIWKKRETLERTTSTRSYIYTAYRRLLIDKINLQNRNITLDIPENLTEKSVQELIIHGEVSSEKIVSIKKGIEKLPPRQKEIILLRFYNGLDYQEIAEILDINYQSVRNSIHKALTAIRKSVTIILVFLFF